MTEILIARHAESIANTCPDRICGRSSEAPLTERGIEQARLLGHYLKIAGIMPDVVYVSPSVRTRQTMKIALDVVEYPRLPVIDGELEEMSQGGSEGHLRQVVYTDKVVAQIQKEPFDFKLPGGESISEVGLRMQRRMRIYTERHPHGTVLIGGHGMTINCLAGLALDWSHERMTQNQYTPENTSITMFHVGQHGIDPASICYTSPSDWTDVVH